MLNISFRRPVRKLPVPAAVEVSPVESAIDAFLASLMSGEAVDYSIAYDTVTIARERRYTRSVQLWRVYNNALGWS